MWVVGGVTMAVDGGGVDVGGVGGVSDGVNAGMGVKHVRPSWCEMRL